MREIQLQDIYRRKSRMSLYQISVAEESAPTSSKSPESIFRAMTIAYVLYIEYRDNDDSP